MHVCTKFAGSFREWCLRMIFAPVPAGLKDPHTATWKDSFIDIVHEADRKLRLHCVTRGIATRAAPARDERSRVEIPFMSAKSHVSWRDLADSRRHYGETWLQISREGRPREERLVGISSMMKCRATSIQIPHLRHRHYFPMANFRKANSQHLEI